MLQTVLRRDGAGCNIRGLGMAELCWTDDVPKKPGYYWCRVRATYEAPAIVRVEAHAGVLKIHYTGTEVHFTLDMLAHAQWAGPIKRPQETP